MMHAKKTSYRPKAANRNMRILTISVPVTWKREFQRIQEMRSPLGNVKRFMRCEGFQSTGAVARKSFKRSRVSDSVSEEDVLAGRGCKAGEGIGDGAGAIAGEEV